jgi:hypothetical protein
MSIAMLQTQKDTKPWFKEPWPWILMLGPAVVIIAGFITAWLAIKSNDGLVADDYYKQGMTVNQRLQRDHKAIELGLHADVMLSGANVRLLLGATDKTHYPEKIVLKLMHPTQAGKDNLVQMESEGEGFYSGKLAAEISGRWHVSIEDPASQWRLQSEWQADSMEPLHIGAERAEQ